MSDENPTFTRSGGSHNNLSLIIGLSFAVAAGVSDFQKSHLSFPDYVGKKIDGIFAPAVSIAKAPKIEPTAK